MAGESMQVSVESTGALERKMTVQVPAATVEEAVLDRLRRVGKTARLKGFRPGKIPLNVVRQHYGPKVRSEVLGELMQNTFSEALVKEKLQPAGGAQFEPRSIDQGQDLEYTAVFEVYPQVRLENLDGLSIEKPVVEIEDADVDKMVDTLRRQRAEFQEVERPAAHGDRVTMDYVGRIDGKEFAGGQATDQAVVLGTGMLLPDLEEGLVGLAARDSKKIDVAFPANYHADELAGKTAEFEVTVKRVDEELLPELTDEFLASFGVTDGGVEEFRTEVRRNMQRELDEKVAKIIKAATLEQLLDKNPVELPRALVDREVSSLQDDMRRRLGRTEGDESLPREPFVAQAERRVALGLLIGELIESQGIELDEDKLTAKLETIASGYEKPQEVIRAYRGNHQLMHQVEAMVLEDQAIDWLTTRCEVIDKPISFKALMETD